MSGLAGPRIAFPRVICLPKVVSGLREDCFHYCPDCDTYSFQVESLSSHFVEKEESFTMSRALGELHVRRSTDQGQMIPFYSRARKGESVGLEERSPRYAY